MSGFTVPFPHTALLLVGVAAAAAAGSLLPAGRWRWWASLGIGVVVGAAAAAAGLVPWMGELHLAAYGVLLLGAFVVAYALSLPRARIVGIPERRLVDGFLLAMLGGLAGARARYVWERPELFTRTADGTERPTAEAIALMVDFDRGGMVWYGGLTLAAILVALYAWRARMRVLELGDAIAPGLLAGLAVGRVGCFLNGCCHGRPTSVPWAVDHDGVHVHPTQLYETLVAGSLAALCWWWWRRRTADGQVIALAAVGYGAWRFLNETLRGDDSPALRANWLGLPDREGVIGSSQATSLHLIVLVVVVSIAVHVFRRLHPEAALAARRVPGSRHAQPGPPAPEAGTPPAQTP